MGSRQTLSCAEVRSPLSLSNLRCPDCGRPSRKVLSGREMGRLYHAEGVERLVRNSLWQGRTQERFYDAMEWLYSWNAGNCLAD